MRGNNLLQSSFIVFYQKGGLTGHHLHNPMFVIFTISNMNVGKMIELIFRLLDPLLQEPFPPQNDVLLFTSASYI